MIRLGAVARVIYQVASIWAVLSMAATLPLEKCPSNKDISAYEECLLSVAAAFDPSQASSSCISRGGNSVVFLKHLRKTGGTTLRKLIMGRLRDRFQAGCSQEIVGIADEMTIMHSLNPILLAHAADHPPILLAAAFREPLSRILSSFHFEGNKVNNKKTNCRGASCDGQRSLSQYIDDLETKARETYKISPQNMWNSVSNYYTRVFSGTPESSPVLEVNYRCALDRIAIFDVVFITERFYDESTSSLIRALLPPSRCSNGSQCLSELRNESKIALGVSNHNTYKNSSLGATTVAALAQTDPVTNAKLRSLNRWDIRLYKFAQELSAIHAKRWAHAFEAGHCNFRCDDTLSLSADFEFDVLPSSKVAWNPIILCSKPFSEGRIMGTRSKKKRNGGSKVSLNDLGAQIGRFLG